MTKLLAVIPHYYKFQSKDARYGSSNSPAETRSAALASCICSLRATFGDKIDIVVCTTSLDHLLSRELDKVVEHRICDVSNPKTLGFECHDVLAERSGEYQYFAYIEDDIVVSDAMFIEKLTSFNRMGGDRAILLPNRFERLRQPPFLKAYIDGPLNSRLTKPLKAVARYENMNQQVLEFLDTSILLRRPNNPHAGCFCLNANQLNHWKLQPDFGRRCSHFISELETAATWGIFKNFRVYKPSPQDSGFLEVEHVGSSFIDKYVSYIQNQ